MMSRDQRHSSLLRGPPLYRTSTGYRSAGPLTGLFPVRARALARSADGVRDDLVPIGRERMIGCYVGRPAAVRLAGVHRWPHGSGAIGGTGPGVRHGRPVAGKWSWNFRFGGTIFAVQDPCHVTGMP